MRAQTEGFTEPEKVIGRIGKADKAAGNARHAPGRDVARGLKMRLLLAAMAVLAAGPSWGAERKVAPTEAECPADLPVRLTGRITLC